MLLSYKYRIYPNRVQASALAEMLSDFCSLYNAALQQRIEAYRRCGVTLSYLSQANELKDTRAADCGLERWSFSAEQQVLRRLDKAFKGFFSRVKSGKNPGFPRFRSASRYHAAEFRVANGMTLKASGRIAFVGVPGSLKVKWHRQMPSRPSSAVLTRQCGKWYIVFHTEAPESEHSSRESVGIDVGLSSIVALSNGETIGRPNWTKRAKREIRRKHRALSRCRIGSKRRLKAKQRLARQSAKTASQRRDFLHKISNDITGRFSAVAVEDLNIVGLARGMLAKEVHDAAWSQLISMLHYKAEKAGGEVIKVDPRGTSQVCPSCGAIKAKRLSQRKHDCECGYVADRDVAAAQIVHLRAFGHGTCLRTPSQRVAA